MSKRYMDFVPVNNVDKKSAVVVGAPRRVNVANSVTVTTTKATAVPRPKVMMPEAGATPRTRMARRDVSRHAVTQRKVVRPETMVQQREMVVQRKTTAQRSAASFAIKSEVKLGEIEDLSPKFVNMDVPKRPLGDGLEHKEAVRPEVKNDAKSAKSKKLIGRFRNKATPKAVSRESNNATNNKADTFVTPKPAFINQDKVTKRPLSKNVYRKKITATNEQIDKGPVAIIAKPEKESKAGLIVAIILTIILGAVAGTVAFLLLPK